MTNFINMHLNNSSQYFATKRDEWMGAQAHKKNTIFYEQTSERISEAEVALDMFSFCHFN